MFGYPSLHYYMSDPLKSVLTQQLEQLVSQNIHLLFKDVQHGIEKEGLRVDILGETR